MAGLFDKYDLPSNEGVSGSGKGYINAPLGYFDKKPPKEYHSGAKGTSMFDFKMSSPNFKKLQKKLGLKTTGRRSKRNFQLLIYNDASRDPTDGEMARGQTQPVFYAKFIEYGFMWYNNYWVPGIRLFEKNRRNFVKIVQRNMQKQPGFFTIAKLGDSLEKSGAEIAETLAEQSPVDTGTLQDAWSYKVIEY